MSESEFNASCNATVFLNIDWGRRFREGLRRLLGEGKVEMATAMYEEFFGREVVPTEARLLNYLAAWDWEVDRYSK